MKRVKRAGVFETNSSSMHSVSVRKSNPYFDYDLEVDDYDDYVHSRFGEYGWEIESYWEPYEKLSYALTMVAETEQYKSEEEFYKTKGFQDINNLIKEKCNCEGVIIDCPGFELHTYDWLGELRTYMDHNGYIDHQSTEDYKSLEDFLNDWDVSLEEFIFNTEVILHTDNDNH